jgi:hypothetical protein
MDQFADRFFNPNLDRNVGALPDPILRHRFAKPGGIAAEIGNIVSYLVRGAKPATQDAPSSVISSSRHCAAACRGLEKACGFARVIVGQLDGGLGFPRLSRNESVLGAHRSKQTSLNGRSATNLICLHSGDQIAGKNKETISNQNCVRLAENTVQSLPAPARFCVVETREVVLDE